jgi:hypothetical protein
MMPAVRARIDPPPSFVPPTPLLSSVKKARARPQNPRRVDQTDTSGDRESRLFTPCSICSVTVHVKWMKVEIENE